MAPRKEVGAVATIVAAILAVAAIAVNELIKSEGNISSLTYHWSGTTSCYLGACVESKYEDACNTCKKIADASDCDTCKMKGAGQAWVALNGLAIAVLAFAAIAVFLDRSKLQKVLLASLFSKPTKKHNKMAPQKSSVIGAVAGIVAAVLAVAAIGVNELIKWEDSALGVESSLTYHWSGTTSCGSLFGLGGCVESKYEDACDLCKKIADASDCDSCTMMSAGQAWVALNGLAIAVLAFAAIAVFLDRSKFAKGFAGIAFLAIALALVVYYAVADETGAWNGDEYGAENFGVSGWLDVVAALCSAIAIALD
eukprot:CAMPEP_0202728616 /NCGR_PEP_ID=MMETSP1385-20130828/185716_1 /ASSEMBLY_ACC=CAM_ASM_000861 /TAXON_ID=933848 /ORGANISM="Elphidium margaritaceum" /LENGTH=310 /DNA_ID=CAMNT_0049394867 /DNA_START=56 /DNA_END=989 /DNA_ORIENTATION=+